MELCPLTAGGRRLAAGPAGGPRAVLTERFLTSWEGLPAGPSQVRAVRAACGPARTSSMRFMGWIGRNIPWNGRSMGCLWVFHGLFLRFQALSVPTFLLVFPIFQSCTAVLSFFFDCCGHAFSAFSRQMGTGGRTGADRRGTNGGRAGVYSSRTAKRCKRRSARFRRLCAKTGVVRSVSGVVGCRNFFGKRSFGSTRFRWCRSR